MKRPNTDDEDTLPGVPVPADAEAAEEAERKLLADKPELREIVELLPEIPCGEPAPDWQERVLDKIDDQERKP